MITFFDDIITSKQNKCVKEAALLLRTKGRKEAGMTRIDGIKLFCEAVACGVEIPRIYLLESRSKELLNAMDAASPDWRERLSSAVYMLSESAFSQITEEKSPEGVICLLKYLDKSEKSGTIIKKEFSCDSIIRRGKCKSGRSIALDAIRDPGNLGTIIRTCLAFGITNIYMSADCAEVTSPKVIRSSMGAVFAASLYVCESLPQTLCALKDEGFRINAAALYGSPVLISETPLCERDVFVIGNEGHGLSDEVLAVADRCVIIDMQTGPGCESLNAAVAACVCAWEQKRRCDLEK
jgi:TrmH family RNA methyltransferase